MSLEERFVACNILHSYNTARSQGYNLVDKLHGITVRKKLANAVNIHHRGFVAIIYRSLNLMLAYLTAYQTGKLVVYRMARTGRYDTAFERLSDKRHITYDVK